MNLPTKKLIFIIAPLLLAGVAFGASYSKEPEAKAKKKGKNAPMSAKANNDGENILDAVRNGQLAKLNWHIVGAVGEFKQIEIVRSSTGKKSQQTKVAMLKPDATSYQDSLPDERPYWYSVRMLKTDGNVQVIGPARVDADGAGAANYVIQENAYTTSVTRTDDFTTLKWDFPAGECGEIKIIRSTRPLSEPFRKPRYKTDVATTMEAKSQYVDALPDANSDYWYWFRIKLKSGTVVDKGPFKAEYAERASR